MDFLMKMTDYPAKTPFRPRFVEKYLTFEMILVRMGDAKKGPWGIMDLFSVERGTVQTLCFRKYNGERLPDSSSVIIFHMTRKLYMFIL
ncbi:MAG TPA: hypothetical protein DHW39_00755 [Erysipelotrichaceae bacterium]|nr:hypothetical protein [Erysipelotrichaceae bacterium]